MRFPVFALVSLLLAPAVLAQSSPPVVSQPPPPAITSAVAPSVAPTPDPLASNTVSVSLLPSTNPLTPSQSSPSTAPASSTESSQPTPSGCLGASFGSQTDYFPDKVTVDKSSLFSVQYNLFYKLVTNLRTSEVWMVYCTASRPNTTFSTKGYFQVPLSGSIAAVDMTIIGYLDLLGLSSSVKYVGDTSNITSPCLSSSGAQAFSNSLSPPPDVALVFQKDQAPNNPTYVTTSTVDYDLTPLQRAEWIKYYAALTNTEAQANKIYPLIEAAYQCHQKNIASSTIAMRRKITFTTFDGAAQAWTFSNTTYHNALAADAGAQLWVPPQPKLFGSESLHSGLQNTSLLVDSTPFNAPPSYQNWLSNAGYDPSKFASAEAAAESTAKSSNQPYVNPFDAPPFIRYNRLYRPDLTGNSHTWDFTSLSPARADLVLLDLILAQFPSYQPSASREFLRLLSPNSTESPHAASYACPPTVDTCSDGHPISDTQTDNPLLSSGEPGSLSMTTKVILGVVGGMVGLAVISGALVHLRRRIKDSRLSSSTRGAWKGVKAEDEEVEMVPEGRF